MKHAKTRKPKAANWKSLLFLFVVIVAIKGAQSNERALEEMHGHDEHDVEHARCERDDV